MKKLMNLVLSLLLVATMFPLTVLAEGEVTVTTDFPSTATTAKSFPVNFEVENLTGKAYEGEFYIEFDATNLLRFLSLSNFKLNGKEIEMGEYYGMGPNGDVFLGYKSPLTLEANAKVIISADAVVIRGTEYTIDSGFKCRSENVHARSERVKLVSTEDQAFIDAVEVVSEKVKAIDSSDFSVKTAQLFAEIKAITADFGRDFFARLDEYLGHRKVSHNYEIKLNEYTALSQSQVANVIEAINNLPAKEDVTLEDEAKIKAAVDMYVSLIGYVKDDVTNKETLFAVQDAYDALVVASSDKRVEAYIKAVETIGEVTYTDECLAKIEAALKLESELLPNDRLKISETKGDKFLDKVFEAKNTYEELKEQAELDAIELKRVEAIVKEIDAIVIDGSEECINLIDTLSLEILTFGEKAYNLITNYNGKNYEEILAQKAEEHYTLVEDLYTIEYPISLINDLADEVSFKNLFNIEQANANYDLLTEAQKALVPAEVKEKLNKVNEKAEVFYEENKVIFDTIEDLSEKYVALLENKNVEASKPLIDELNKALENLSDEVKNALEDLEPGALKEVSKDIEKAEEAYDAFVDANKDDVPETGDSSSVLLWASMSAATLCLAMIVYVLKLKTSRR